MKNFNLLKGKKIFFAGVMMLALLGCEKNTPTPNEESNQEKAMFSLCTPYRNVVGYDALCLELNSISNCLAMCSVINVSTLTHMYLVNPATGNNFIFGNGQTITPSQQNDVMLAAKAWANANKPAGKIVKYIAYSPDIITSGSTISAGIDITVTYGTCISTGPK